MSKKSTSVLIICATAICSLAGRSLADADISRAEHNGPLRVHLPREVTVNDSRFTLGQVSIIRGPESFVATASQIALGRISVPNQKIIIEKNVVLSRLASSGITASKVVFTGADQTTVKKQHEIIKANDFVDLANSFLKKNLSQSSVCELKPIQTPEDLVLPGASQSINLSTSLPRGSAVNKPRVRIDVFADGKRIGTRQVVFALKYNRRTAIALVDIPKGAVINPDDVNIATRTANYPEPDNWSPPYGHIATRAIDANSVIEPYMTASAKPQVLVKRNETVLVRLEIPGLLITAAATALQNGAAGDLIKVRNVDSKIIICVKVNEDGTVEPVF